MSKGDERNVLLAICPHCKAETKLVLNGAPGSTSAMKYMFSMFKPLHLAIQDHVEGARKGDAFECIDCKAFSRRCTKCETLFIGKEGEILCPPCHSNPAANG